MGAEAVFALMDAKPETEASVISIEGNQTVRTPLMGCVERVSPSFMLFDVFWITSREIGNLTSITLLFSCLFCWNIRGTPVATSCAPTAITPREIVKFLRKYYVWTNTYHIPS